MREPGLRRTLVLSPSTNTSAAIMRPTTRILLLMGLLICAGPAQGRGQDFAEVDIGTQRITDGVYMLTGQGGNIGVSIGDDGVFMIDDQYAPLTERILSAIRNLTSEPVRFVFNTHWHGDHTGGNENLGEAGALIVAHDNVHGRMSVEQVLERIGRPTASEAAAPERALPVVTFTTDITFFINDDVLRAFHVEDAHTDGDAIVHFERANVVHMGDTFFRDRFPFIDTATGGLIDGMIAAAGRALTLMDGDTQVIPGHGPLSSRQDLMDYRDALWTMRNAVATLKEEGLTLEEIQARRPIRDHAGAWGQDQADEDIFVATIHQGL